MTFHYFTLYPTLNGMSKQTTLAKKVDYELLEEILVRTRSITFKNHVKAAEAQGLKTT